MDKHELNELLRHVADGSVSPDDAALKLKLQPFEEVGEYAKVDMHRGIRQGVPEVIYGAGKTKEHILGIARTMLKNGQGYRACHQDLQGGGGTMLPPSCRLNTTRARGWA